MVVAAASVYVSVAVLLLLWLYIRVLLLLLLWRCRSETMVLMVLVVSIGEHSYIYTEASPSRCVAQGDRMQLGIRDEQLCGQCLQAWPGITVMVFLSHAPIGTKTNLTGSVDLHPRDMPSPPRTVSRLLKTVSSQTPDCRCTVIKHARHPPEPQTYFTTSPTSSPRRYIQSSPFRSPIHFGFLMATKTCFLLPEHTIRS